MNRKRKKERGEENSAAWHENKEMWGEGSIFGWVFFFDT
jgi:hypothetical protein